MAVTSDRYQTGVGGCTTRHLSVTLKPAELEEIYKNNFDSLVSVVAGQTEGVYLQNASEEMVGIVLRAASIKVREVFC